MKLIAEIKKASPFTGRLVEDVNLEFRIKEYERLGAAAISIVTAPSFEGEKSWITEAKKHTKLPILQKDFISTVDGLKESKDLGADWVLLIADQLQAEELDTLTFHAWNLGLKPVVEIHSFDSFKKLKYADTNHVVINNRDLRTGKLELMRMYNLLALIPDRFAVIAASGLDTEVLGELHRVRAVDYALVGTLLMKSPNLENTFKEIYGKS